MKHGQKLKEKYNVQKMSKKKQIKVEDITKYYKNKVMKKRKQMKRRRRMEKTQTTEEKT